MSQRRNRIKPSLKIKLITKIKMITKMMMITKIEMKTKVMMMMTKKVSQRRKRIKQRMKTASRMARYHITSIKKCDVKINSRIMSHVTTKHVHRAGSLVEACTRMRAIK